MKTTYIKIDSEDQLPVGVIRNTTRPNLFGCLYTDTKTLKVEREYGVLEGKINVCVFKKILDDGFVELLNMEEIEYNIPLGKYVYKRQADVVVYYLKSSSEIDIHERN